MNRDTRLTIYPSPYHPMTLRAINAFKLGQDRQVVRAGVATDPGGEGAEMRGVPDIVDSEQGRQGELTQWMSEVGQVLESRRQCETVATTSSAEGVDQSR
jgi:hypothetical protein